MKILPTSKACAFLGGLLLLATGAGAQKSATGKTKTDSLLEARNFTFHANMMQPLAAPQQTLTAGYYDLIITRDSVTAYLPYAGRAYVAPVDPMEGGIKFTSRNFSYTTRVRKNGMHEITIAPSDIKDIQRLYFFIGTDGFATLQVVRVTAQQVNFTGQIDEK